MRVEVVPHNSSWRDEFAAESKRVAMALDKIVAVHHIGSTSITNIYAKPVIDLLVEVSDITQVDEHNTAMQALGYEVMGEYGISGRRYFRKDNTAGQRTHHVHVFETASFHAERHLAFQDYRIAHPEAAQQYSKLKRAHQRPLNPTEMEGYMDGKDSFIKAMEQRAMAWRLKQKSREIV